MKNIFLLLLLPFFSLAAEEEIIVRLREQKQLDPLYLSSSKNNSAFLDSYLQEIDSILQFDLNQTGFSYLVAKDPEKEHHLLKEEDPKKAFDSSFWTNQNLKFVLRPVLSSDALIVQVFDLKKRKLHNFSSVTLTGEISSDREKLHRLISQIQKQLFGTEGVFHKKILYSLRTENPSNRENHWTSEIWICDFDGKNARQLTHEKGYSISPRFITKDPGSFAFVSFKLGQSKIFRSTKTENWIPLRGNQALPTLTLSSDTLAFICDAAGRPDLFIQSLDAKGELIGKPKQIFSFPRATQASPTFSPDGKKIAFVSDKDGPPRIYILDLSNIVPSETPQVELITKANRQNTSPSWSPDGTKLAYSAKTDDVRQIWIYDFNSKEERQLTFGNKNMENPYWAIDSIHLIFNSEDETCSELFIANIYQSETIKITEGPGQKRFPSWEY